MLEAYLVVPVAAGFTHSPVVVYLLALLAALVDTHYIFSQLTAWAST